MLENRSAAVNSPSPVRPLGVDLPSRQRSARSNNPLAGLDMNTARGRRVADLVRAYFLALGNPVEIERQAAIIAAGELQVIAEEARTAALRKTGNVDLDQVVRTQRAADRAVRLLGLDRKREPAGPTLSEYLASRYGAERGEDATGGEAPAEEETQAGEPPEAVAGHYADEVVS